MTNEKIVYPHLPESLDRRVKIPKSEHETIKYAYTHEGYSLRSLAQKYGVDKRTIQFILYPERLIKARENRDWSKYYTKEKQREYMRKHRAHKMPLQGDQVNAWALKKRKQTEQKQPSV